MKKSASLLLCFAMVFTLAFGSVGSALAARKVTKVVTGKIGASLRSSPEIMECNKLCGIHADVYLNVYGECNGWYYVNYNGQYGWVNASSQIVTVVATEEMPSAVIPGPYGSSPAAPVQPVTPAQYGYSAGPAAGYAPNTERYPYLGFYDMGIPQIGGAVFTLNQMNMVIFWVQTQLKATGAWYQGSQWEVNGCLSEHTMSEIRSFMASTGHYGHSGTVDQGVVNALAAYLGSRIMPVYTGGFYNYMGTVLSGDPYGTMPFIVSNLRDNVPRETVGARWVQTILSGLGYYTGQIDGKYGTLTQNAVIGFQRDNGFQQTDFVTLGVARAMLEQYYRLNKDMSRLP